MPQRSLSYSGLDKIDTGLQAQRSTLIQSQNRYMERTGEPRNRMPTLGNLTSENRTPSDMRAAQQTGFGDPTGQAHGYDPRRPIDADPQREDLGIPGETGTQNENKKTSEDTEKEEEETVTPKSNRKAKGSSNKRSRETEPELPSSPPPALKKRVDMISCGSENHTPDKIERRTKGRVCINITIAVRTLENLNEATPPPSITRYNPNAGSPFRKTPNLKRKQKMARIRELLERPIPPQIQKKDSM
ncbi:hypothetical protein DY000_02022057 [Brassica cretica]|uniref:Uncharacterized protein n=1 Tax=Brassica cretica TaxID=69181 RepID=A0ABQ7ECQ6_BRACR|nr:hypothetical protein DY000_02022057 [Brassica cretica]